jgi:hypothetical protein
MDTSTVGASAILHDGESWSGMPPHSAAIAEFYWKSEGA